MKLPKSAKSLFFYQKGKAKIAPVATPYDVFEKNRRSGGRWNVAIKPLVVGVCPSDMAGGWRDFPPGSRRPFDNSKKPAIAGHEFVGKVVDATKTGFFQLKKRGIKIGDLVAGDINVGCGYCFACRRGDPPVYCVNGTTFAGVGSSPRGEAWVRQQTGWAHPPGAYTQGFIVLPATNLYKIPQKIKELYLFSQADAVACSKTSADTMGITTFKQLRGFDHPSILVIGAGRLGMWHIAVIKDFLPNSPIFIADIDQKNLKLVGSLFKIPGHRQYLVKGKNPYARQKLEKAFGKGVLFDFIIDTAGHGVLRGSTITQLLLTSVTNGGKFWTTAHTGVLGVDAGHPLLLLGGKAFGNGLSPQNNFPYAIDFLAREGKKYRRAFVELKGGLDNQNLADIIATGGGDYKHRVSGTIFYSVLG